MGFKKGLISQAVELLEIDERMIASVPRVFEPPLPFSRRAEHLAGELPIEQVDLFLLGSPRLYANVFVFPAYSLDFLKRGV